MVTKPQDEVLAFLLQHPLHRAMGLRSIEVGDRQASFEVEIGPDIVTPADRFHGGVVYALIDIAALSALLRRLQAGQTAVTHDLHVAMLRSARRGQRARFEARVLRQGGALAFIEVDVTCQGERLARATVTKSILSDPTADQRNR